MYVHTCPNGKKYVGITHRDVKTRWQYGCGYRDCTLFQKAITKFGWNNISHEVLFCDLSKEEAENKEIELIESLNLLDHRFGYNLRSGGGSSRLSEETKRKIGDKLKGQVISREQILKRRQTMIDRNIPNRPCRMAVEISALLRSIEVSQYDKNGEYIRSFKSISQAQSETGIYKENISSCLSGKRKSAGGYFWKQTENERDE